MTHYQGYARRVQPKPHFFTLWPTLFSCNIYDMKKKGSGYQRNRTYTIEALQDEPSWLGGERRGRRCE